MLLSNFIVIDYITKISFNVESRENQSPPVFLESRGLPIFTFHCISDRGKEPPCPVSSEMLQSRHSCRYLCLLSPET